MTPDDAIGCRALWVSVLESAVAHPVGKPSGISANQRQTTVHAARTWFKAGRSPGSEFQTVCGLAGIELGPLHRVIMTQIDQLENHMREVA